jgi:8-oxo-dGTP pyrophosphatase MutT (NUDIX family)
MQWQVNRSRIVFRDRWVSLRADDCVTPSGVEISPFYVLEYPDWVHVVALDAENHVILVQQYRHGFGGITLELPGGMMDTQDGDPVTTAARELAEETGYTAGAFRLLASLSPNPATHTNRLHVVLGESVQLTKEPAMDVEENIVVVRMPALEALQMALRGDMVHAQHIGLLAIGLNAAGLGGGVL